MLKKYEIIRLIDKPEYKESMSDWFSSKWNIPKEAYMESMDVCIKNQASVPQWYAVMDCDKIIGGLGVIDNDFHNRKDLTPNVCAVYVEEPYRCQGIAGDMLKFVCKDMADKGIGTLYLVTDHTSFYERYGWRFLCMVQGDGETDMTRMYIYEG